MSQYLNTTMRSFRSRNPSFWCLLGLFYEFFKYFFFGFSQLREKIELLMPPLSPPPPLSRGSQSNYVISLALVAVSEICTRDMMRELVSYVITVIKTGTSFVKKKGALAACKIIRQLPDTIEEFIPLLESIMQDRHHGNHLAAKAASIFSVRHCNPRCIAIINALESDRRVHHRFVRDKQACHTILP